MWGDKIEFLERVAEEDGVLPKALQSRPELEEHLLFVWSAFQTVSTDRPVGLGLAPIPFSAIDRFARRYGIVDIDEFDRLHRLIGQLDRALLDDEKADQEREAAAKNRKR